RMTAFMKAEAEGTPIADIDVQSIKVEQNAPRETSESAVKTDTSGADVETVTRNPEFTPDPAREQFAAQ
ncbi:hypothetical protein, partial [Staphylococcus aureus]